MRLVKSKNSDVKFNIEIKSRISGLICGFQIVVVPLANEPHNIAFSVAPVERIGK